MSNCYNCGKPVSRKDKTETKEHIPAQNLFEGFGDKYKTNRIVVPSCFDCNQKSSIIDEEFRNVIGAISNHDELNSISQNSAKGIIHYNKQIDRLKFGNNGNIIAVTFDESHILNYHIKIFKGLFYNQYKYPLSKEYKTVALFRPNETTSDIINYLTSNFNWKSSGHPDIFAYILQPFRENLKNIIKKDLSANKDETFYLSIQKYNNSHACVVIATFSIEHNHLDKF